MVPLELRTSSGKSRICIISMTSFLYFSAGPRSRGARVDRSAPCSRLRGPQLLAVGVEDVQVSVLPSDGRPPEHSAGHHAGGPPQQPHYGEVMISNSLRLCLSRSNFSSQLNLLQFANIFIQSAELVQCSFVLIGQILRYHRSTTTKYPVSIAKKKLI